LDATDRRWIQASLKDGGGLRIEPFVEITMEFAQHAWLARDGALLAGTPTRLCCAADGSFVSSAPAGDCLGPQERAALRAALARCGSALHELGYFGPFGIDAFRWRDAGGRARFLPFHELNARYTMG